MLWPGLPPELQAHILSFLSWEDLGRMAIVSTDLKELSESNSLWKTHYRHALAVQIAEKESSAMRKQMSRQEQNYLSVRPREEARLVNGGKAGGDASSDLSESEMGALQTMSDSDSPPLQWKSKFRQLLKKVCCLCLSREIFWLQSYCQRGLCAQCVRTRAGEEKRHALTLLGDVIRAREMKQWRNIRKQQIKEICSSGSLHPTSTLHTKSRFTCAFDSLRFGFSLGVMHHQVLKNAQWGPGVTKSPPVILLLEVAPLQKHSGGGQEDVAIPSHVGAFLSTGMGSRNENDFIGSSDCFLFTLNPLQIFPASGDDENYIKFTNDFLGFGGGGRTGFIQDQMGLCLCRDLRIAYSHRTVTYRNPPLVPSHTSFGVRRTEVWRLRAHDEEASDEEGTDEDDGAKSVLNNSVDRFMLSFVDAGSATKQLIAQRTTGHSFW